MSSVVHSVIGAALLLTGATAAMAQSANPPVANQPVQTGATAPRVASNNAPAANQPVQTGTAPAKAALNNAAAAGQVRKPHDSTITDNNDPYGGHDPNSSAGARAFFVPQY
jgi:hypothetical protein